eukprot:TRINITY_DN5291_c0_g1_i1.p1 TRINITY_DN5291_c0_g1~~TRINITY_DN5291_c0_g1_i1.p1  ORF type:complete len:369 (-),score=89.08 TRINITY_DN5291_c0_g1_i1:129-1160(-)
MVCDVAGGSLFYEASVSSRPEQDCIASTGESDCPFLSPLALQVEPAKLYTKKLGTLRIRLVKSWRESLGLSNADVLQAAKDCVCCKPGCLNTELECALCCKNHEKVVGVTTNEPSAPTTLHNCGDGTEFIHHGVMEEFTYSVRSLCSSSSNHMQAPTVVLVCVLGGVQVKSSQFTLLSRMWKSKRLMNGMIVNEQPRNAPFKHYKSGSPQELLHPVCMPGAGFHIVVKVAAVSVRLSFAVANALLGGFDHFWADGELQRRDKVLYPLCSTEALVAAASGVVPEEQAGQVWYCALISVHSSAGSAAQLQRLAFRYASNSGLRNVLNMNLFHAGLLCCLANFSNA